MADTNLTKKNRREMIEFLEKIKSSNNDDETLRMVNKIENTLTEKKFWLVFEEHREEVDEKLLKEIPVFCEDNTRRICKDENLPWNFIIEWDNLQALYLLLKTHRWRINVIYIDPPYNTWAHDWKYNNDYVDTNDGYRHSKWLSMMKVRLELAKQLLTDDGVLICTIDEKEYLHLGCLLEEMFPEANIQMVTTIINLSGTGRVNEFTRTNEYVYFVRLGNAKIYPIVDNSVMSKKITWAHLHRSEISNSREKTKAQFYPIFVNNKTKKIDSVWKPLLPGQDRNEVTVPDWCTAVFPVRDDEIETMWWCTREELLNRIEKWYVRVGQYRPNNPQKYAIWYLKSGVINDIENGIAILDWYDENGAVIAHYESWKKKMPTTVMNNPLHDANRYWTKIVSDILWPGKFSYPKSLYAVEDCLKFVLWNNKNAIVLDFFAGSGTTMHAVNLMNAEDGWNRQCIIVTNNEIWEKEEKRLTDLWYKKWDEERENIWIAKYITWPRIKCSIMWVNTKNHPLDGTYITCDKPMSDWFKTNVKYFKCDWTPRKPEDYFLSNILLLHIKEMIELENAVEIDGVKNVAILNKDDYKNFIENDDIYNKIENIWVNQNIIFDAKEFEKLKKKNFKYIPVEYFWQELKDVAE